MVFNSFFSVLSSPNNIVYESSWQEGTGYKNMENQSTEHDNMT